MWIYRSDLALAILGVWSLWGARAGVSLVSVRIGMSFVILLVLAVIPTLAAQLTALVNSAPDSAKKLQSFLLERFPDLADSTSTIRQTLAKIGAVIQERWAVLAESVLSSALGLISIVLFIVVVPVVAFYLLLDWDDMVAKIDGMLPLDHAPTVRRLAREIDAVLAGFVRGQVSVCLALGTFYAVALMAAGLQFGLVVGAIAGAITFIPYIGSLVGGTLAIGLALFQFWGDWLQIGIIAAIFAVGQFVEGNILTPRLVGKSVGLHPVWLLFALSAFGTVFGFVGMLIAVPVAASIGVLTRFAFEQYRASLLYQGKTALAARAFGHTGYGFGGHRRGAQPRLRALQPPLRGNLRPARRYPGRTVLALAVQQRRGITARRRAGLHRVSGRCSA